MNKLFTKIASLVLGMTMAVGVGVAVGTSSIENKSVFATDYTDVHVLDTTGSLQTDNSTYGSTGTVENDGIDWTFTGNGKINPWRLGGKTKQSGDQPFYTQTALSSAVDRIVVEFGTLSGVTATSFQMSVHSTAADAASGDNAVETHSGLDFGGNVTATIDLTNQQSGKFYRFVPNLTISASSNKYLQLKKVTFKQATKTLSSISVSGYTTEFTVGDDFSFGGTVTAHYSDSTTANVTSSTTFSGYNMSVAGNYTVTASYTEGGTTKTATYGITVSESTAPTILLDSNSFSGYIGQSFSVTATYSNLTSAFAWSISGSGTTTETITSTGTETDGTSTYSGTLTGEGTKVLTATGGGVSEQARPTFTITITQTLRPVMAPTPGEKTTSTLTFKEKYSEGGATSDGGEKWTVTSDGTESNFDNTKGIHYGTSSASVQYIKLASTDFTSGKITKVVANASTASGVSATVSVKVGDSAFGGAAQSITSSAAEYTFNGDVDAGTIEVLITKPSSATKAIYCKSIAVTYETEGESVNIANAAGHEAAQHAVVRFAKRFNAIMDGTNNCTTGLSDAWSAITLVYDNPSAQTEAEKGFLQDIASLSSTEQDYAKKMIKYATAQWTEDTDENYEYCLERAMATYEYCVKKHEGCTAFMDSVRPVERTHVNPISIFGSTENTNAIAIVVIVSVVSLTAIGGYFFLRKKREQN